MPKKNAIYAQSGGVTAVINATACGLIETSRQHKSVIGKVYAGLNGIKGVLAEDLVDTSKETVRTITALRYTPAGVFGSCRHKLKSMEQSRTDYERLIAVFRAHNIGYFFYNGGGDSQDTAHKVAQMGQEMGYPVCCIGIPKTIDNDLALTDNCPGFGSVAKYVAVSTREAAYDVASMAASSTKIFVLEVMGRHAGWIAAASGLAAEFDGDAPHIILLPEVAFSKARFLARVKAVVEQVGYCVIVVSEGLRDSKDQFISETGNRDAFGHAQLGGVAPIIAQMIHDRYGYKFHWAVSDYLQRSARHIASRTDVDQAYAMGVAAVKLALAGKNAVMPTIVRTADTPYRWKIGEARLSRVANREKKMPKSFIRRDGFGITASCRRYLQPLIEGEDPPPFKHGLPQYARLKKVMVKKKLGSWG